MRLALLAFAGVVAVAFADVDASHSTTRNDDRNEFVDIVMRLQPAEHQYFEQTLYAVSDPRDKKYGQHLTREDAMALLAPSPGAVVDIQQWLASQGVTSINVDAYGSAIHAQVPMELANSLGDHRKISQSESGALMTVPYSVREQLSSVRRLFHSGQPRQARRRDLYSAAEAPNTRTAVKRGPFRQPTVSTRNDDVDLEECKERLVPACIRKLYHMNQTTAEPHEKTLYSVPGFRGVSSLLINLLAEWLRRSR